MWRVYEAVTEMYYISSPFLFSFCLAVCVGLFSLTNPTLPCTLMKTGEWWAKTKYLLFSNFGNSFV